MTKIPVTDLFPGDVIRWEELGKDDTVCDVHRVIPEKDGRFTLVIEPRGGRSRNLIVPADLKIARVW